MKLRRTLGPSLRALFAHRVRALLAVSSVTAGVAAVVLTSAIGKGVAQDIRGRIEAIGANLLVVRPAPVKRLVARKDVKGSVSTLRVEDFQAVAQLERIARAVPGIEGPARVVAGGSSTTTKVLGTWPDFPTVRGFEVRRGRFFDEDDDRLARRVAVLGARVADALLDPDAAGGTIRIRGIPFDVVGVLAPKGALAGGDEDNQIVIPLKTALRRVFNVTWLTTMFVRVRDARAMGEVEREIRTLLRGRHRLAPDDPSDFEVQNATGFLLLQQDAARTLTRITGGVAAIALVVGGIGILVLMLLSIRERTSEIGLRMAVGARPRDILVQFLFEATLLALAGWAGGILLGAIGASVVALGTSWKVGMPWEALLASVAMATLIGLGFGALPARRASLIPPIQALRAE